MDHNGGINRADLDRDGLPSSCVAAVKREIAYCDEGIRKTLREIRVSWRE